MLAWPPNNKMGNGYIEQPEINQIPTWHLAKDGTVSITDKSHTTGRVYCRSFTVTDSVGSAFHHPPTPTPISVRFSFACHSFLLLYKKKKKKHIFYISMWMSACGLVTIIVLGLIYYVAGKSRTTNDPQISRWWTSESMWGCIIEAKLPELALLSGSLPALVCMLVDLRG